MKQKFDGDFSKGSIVGNMTRLALPIMLAEFVNITYNIVDRLFIGHIPEYGTLALSGVGVVFPLISLINAFASLFITGGAPLCSIASGARNYERAKKILETSFSFIISIGVLLGVCLFISMPFILRMLGADESTYIFAKEYFSIYLCGTVFVLISLGANSFINMQGDSVIGMFTVLIGAVTNIILDPVFIFVLKMGVRGAAFATVISQFFSALWVVKYLVSKKTKIRLSRFHIDFCILKDVLKLGISGFVFKTTNSITQAVSNMTLRAFGGVHGTLYIGSMSIINSMREVLSLPINAFAAGFQPVASYNYGARKNGRVCRSILDFILIVLSYSLVAWGVVQIFPEMFITIFTPDQELIETTVPYFRIYFGVFFMLAFQVSGQHTFVALNCPKRAVFFSLFRKVILVVPFTLILPRVGLGVKGVFVAEFLSQMIGSLCCFLTMMLSVFRKIRKTPDNVCAEF